MTLVGVRRIQVAGHESMLFFFFSSVGCRECKKNQKLNNESMKRVHRSAAQGTEYGELLVLDVGAGKNIESSSMLETAGAGSWGATSTRHVLLPVCLSTHTEQGLQVQSKTAQ